MLVGLGFDLVDLPRVEAALARRGEALLAKLFSPRERAELAPDLAQGGRRLVERVAARFAAKEAALKALGTGWGGGVGWHDVELLGGRGEAPGLQFGGEARRRFEALGARTARVSWSHADTAAGAVVVLLG